ncbi:HSP20-like chaperones superfamily protein [Quillaja saponaria]|uniref:HSP20-like chaperones superfamily protein n=1 Tax=Quillaja saponaria TaxID=32244 RepID=A0AAD7VMB1_QUISA|nr:HSP20-like chaperones superfamily protein [Quillaja saponaria]KAJ7980875.1 HSP20-like chaperones superfamily protein [Quillaja saponaria]
MGEDLLTSLSMENHHPSTLLSMDSTAVSHEELGLEISRAALISRPPDINLPLAADRSPSMQTWNSDPFDMLDVGLSTQIHESDSVLNLPKNGRKCAKRLDSVWGAWFFFSYYFKPVLNEKSKCKILRDSNGLSGFDKTDLEHEVFLVQHDMENLYMWVFKERPENALGKMQLRSYMNGHSRQGESPFPFSVEKGFVRSHRMQRKHYRGLSNPQCVHGIEVVPSPNLKCLDEEDQKRWMELTGRDLNFSMPREASEYSSWRTLPNTEFELDRTLPPVRTNSHSHPKKLLNGSSLNLSNRPPHHLNGTGGDLLPACNKRKKDLCLHGSEEEYCVFINHHNDRVQDTEIQAIEPPWLSEFSGVMRNVYGPVTAAKTIYEDEHGYLIIVSLPFADLKRVKVTWWNNLTHGVVKISSVSTACMPFIKRNDRTFKLTDPSPEHCPPGEFIREIALPTRIPDDAKLQAYGDETGTGLEIMVPKHRVGPEEHEVRVCLRPHLGGNELVLS